MRSRIRVAVVVTAVAAASGLVGLAPASALNVATRYASPTGTGDCSKATPCQLTDALSSAGGGAEVILAPGKYFESSPLTTGLTDHDTNLDIHGTTGKPMPIIYSAAPAFGFVAENSQTSVSHLEVVYSGGGEAIGSVGTEVDHVIAIATGENAHACSVFPILTDSLCVATGANGDAVQINSSGGPGIYTMLNDTAIATGDGGYGIDFGGGTDATLTLNATNTIARGTAGDVQAYSQAANAVVTINLDHSDYVTDPTTTGPGSETVNDAGHNVRTAAKFVAGKYIEKASSPTVDAGVKVSNDTDVAGAPRYLGGATDIGAYEFAAAPAVSKLTITKATKHTVRATLHVNSEGLKTTVTVAAKHGAHSTKHTVHVAAAHTGKTVTVAFKHLDRKTKYAVSAKAHSQGGDDKTPTMHTKTK